MKKLEQGARKKDVRSGGIAGDDNGTRKARSGVIVFLNGSLDEALHRMTHTQHITVEALLQLAQIALASYQRGINKDIWKEEEERRRRRGGGRRGNRGGGVPRMATSVAWSSLPGNLA